MRTEPLTDTGSVSIPARGGRTADEVRRRRWRFALLFFAVGQPVSSLVFDWLSPTTLQSGAEFSPIVPPGAWFAIWGLIIVASITWAILQVRPSSIGPRPGIRDRVVGPLTVVTACFGLWLATASLGQDNPLGLLVFIVIISAHVVAWTRVVRARDEIATWNPLERGVLYLTLGTYAGWTSMAFFVQIATVTQGTGAPIDGGWGLTWQTLVLLAASGVAVSFVVGTRASIVYALTVTYALAGVGISTAAAGLPLLTVVCVIGVSLVWASVVVIRAVDARPPVRQSARGGASAEGRA